MYYRSKKITEDFLKEIEEIYQKVNGEKDISLMKNMGCYTLYWNEGNELKKLRLSQDEYNYLIRFYFPKFKKIQPRLNKQEYVIQINEIQY